MIKLAREIRFALPPPDEITSRAQANTWAAWPASELLVPHLVLRCILRGEPDPVTGYLCNIKVIDDLLQQVVTEQMIPDYWNTLTGISLSKVLRQIAPRIAKLWSVQPDVYGRVVALELDVSPFLRYSLEFDNPDMVRLTQQFEFSAAHRLHCPQLSDQENTEVFGKCNHPAGHGHNYVVEVCVELDRDEPALPQLESAVKRVVIDRLDHKHLNEDIDYFRTINPSVENIAQAVFNWLQPELQPLRLHRVRVYETPKTWAECEAT
jgi:6-pyruvoyltetrahydropterin/6-carboxytetrahydropterin synthase